MKLYKHWLGNWYYLWGKALKTRKDHRPPELMDVLEERNYEILIAREMITQWHREEYEQPVRGLFTGIRTVSNGYTKVAHRGYHYDGDDHDYGDWWSPYYVLCESFPLYLFVTHYRKNPIYVFPCDVSETADTPSVWPELPTPFPHDPGALGLNWWIFDIIGKREPQSKITLDPDGPPF